MYFNFFHLLPIVLFCYSISFFSFTKFLLKFFPCFLMIRLYYQLLMIYSQLTRYLKLQLVSYLPTQLIKGQIRKMLSSKSKYQSQRKKKGVATQLFLCKIFYFPYCSDQFRILLYKREQYSQLGRTIRKIKEIARIQPSGHSLFLPLP